MSEFIREVSEAVLFFTVLKLKLINLILQGAVLILHFAVLSLKFANLSLKATELILDEQGGGG